MLDEPTTDDWTRSLARVDRLTSRRLEVFLLLGRGMSNRRIALALVVSEHTVKAHIARILKELEVESRLQAGLAAQLYLQELQRRRAATEVTHNQTSGLT